MKLFQKNPLKRFLQTVKAKKILFNGYVNPEYTLCFVSKVALNKRFRRKYIKMSRVMNGDFYAILKGKMDHGFDIIMKGLGITDNDR